MSLDFRAGQDTCGDPPWLIANRTTKLGKIGSDLGQVRGLRCLQSETEQWNLVGEIILLDAPGCGEHVGCAGCAECSKKSRVLHMHPQIGGICHRTQEAVMRKDVLKMQSMEIEFSTNGTGMLCEWFVNTM
jgi:hypothetical protein